MSADPGEAEDVLQLVFKRWELLDGLRDGPTRRSALQDQLDISRSTAYNALKELTQYNLVTRSDAGYQLTLYGQAVLETYSDLYDNVQNLTRARNALAEVDTSRDIRPLLKSDPEIVTPSTNVPDRPVDVFEDLVRDADEVYGFSPITRSRYVSVFGTRILEYGLDATIINESSVVDYLLEHHREDFRSVVQSDHVTFYVTDADLPFGCLVIRSPTPTVACNLYDEQHTLQALIYSETPDAAEWGKSLFEQERERATLLTESFFE